jgi:hypothetical protein
MTKPLRIPISEARARLPELAQRAMASPNSIIIIEHRDYDEKLVLTTEAHYRMLEKKAKNIRPTKPKFKLAGSMSTDLTDEEQEAALLETRAEWDRSFERRSKKLQELG